MSDKENEVATPPVEKTLQERQEAFIKAYGALVEEHKMDFATYPVYTPDGQGGFKTIIQNTPIDNTNHPKKSPPEFVAK